MEDIAYASSSPGVVLCFSLFSPFFFPSFFLFRTRPHCPKSVGMLHANKNTSSDVQRAGTSTWGLGVRDPKRHPRDPRDLEPKQQAEFGKRP